MASVIRFNVLIVLFFLLSFLPVMAETQYSQNHITEQMARKIRYSYDTNQDINGIIFYIISVKYDLDVKELMNAIPENPDEAKPIITGMLDTYGDDSRGRMSLVEGFGFSVEEVEIASKIYQEYKNKKEEENKLKAIDEEKALLEKWKRGDMDFFLNLRDERIIRPFVEVNLSSIAQRHNENCCHNRVEKTAMTNVVITISPEGEIYNMEVNGNLDGEIEMRDIDVVDPAMFRFNQMDTVVSIPCKLSLVIEDNISKSGDLQCRVRHDKKSDCWIIQMDEDCVESRESIVSAIEKAIDSDEELKAMLAKGNHVLNISICRHWLRYENDRFNCQPCAIITGIDSK